jgi:hypothetical protein
MTYEEFLKLESSVNEMWGHCKQKYNREKHVLLAAKMITLILSNKEKIEIKKDDLAYMMLFFLAAGGKMGLENLEAEMMKEKYGNSLS